MDMCMVAGGRAGLPWAMWPRSIGGRVSLDQQAEAAGTISYELLTALGSRVTRRYRSSP